MEEDPRSIERAVLASLPDSVLVVDQRVSVVWANPAAEALFGIRVEDAAGLSGLDLVHPDDFEAAALSMVSVQDKEVGTPVEIRIRAHDGWRLVEVIGRPFGDGLTLLAMRDLTERRLWEVAGNQAELARVIVQNAASMTLLVDPDGVIRTSSGGLTRMLGIDQELVRGRPLVELCCEEDSESLLEGILSASPGDPAVVEARLLNRSGELVPFALTAVDLRDDPTVGGLVISGHDVSDRARAEQELRAALSLLQATLDSTTDGILVVDRSDRVTAINERFTELWGMPLGACVVGQDATSLRFVTELLEDPEGFMARLRELHADPEATSFEVVRFKDGRVLERDSRPQRVDGEIVGRVWSFRDVTATVELQEELTYQAFHDPLTGLANQALFRDRLEHALALLDRRGGRLAVCFVDLDDFKTINDSLGHATGDELLRIVTGRLLECVREIDTVARLGGDEFAVLVEAVGSEREIELIAERIIDTINRPLLLSGRDVVVSASVGIAFGSTSTSAEDLLRNADLAMYTAKADGKSRYRSFAPPMFHAAIERLETEATLRGAAERGELVVHYQPVVSLSDASTKGFEALVRWQHPQRGLLAPGAFIPFAEQVGLIDEIGRHVLGAACAEAATWLPVRDGEQAPTISVNVSPPQLKDPAFPDHLAAILAQSGLPAQRLILEITEGALMSDPLAAIESLRRLESLGCQLAVDDFGTGYSSLAYLQQFPIHILKVDRSFIEDLDTGSSSLVNAIVQLADTLELVAVAEGVETELQAAILRDIGCTFAQGYLFGRPAPAESARLRLEAERLGVRPTAALGQLDDGPSPGPATSSLMA